MRTAIFGISLLVVLGFAGSTFAQPVAPGGGQQPRFGQYLPLLRSSNNGFGNPAIDLYGTIKPQQALAQQQNMIQNQLSQTNQNVNSLENGENLLITGKGASFLNYSHYFNNFGGGGMGSRSGGSGQAATFGNNSTSGRGAGGGTIGQAPTSGSGSRR